ncbi:MAG: hypothetical protein HXY20_06210 [Acidobacteria bacterium]|nr:hypothetical protein [Acidobacteriota bacterium]
MGTPCFRRGDLVTVRSPAEILATLDADAKLDGLPFMPEMIAFCDRTFRVHRRAERTCVEGVGLRRIKDTVLLEGLRCDGSAHGGCERRCLFFWKEKWLRPATGAAVERQPAEAKAAEAGQLPTFHQGRFYCQSTELAAATSELPDGNLQCYLHDLRCGETTLKRVLHFTWVAVANRVWRISFRRDYLGHLTGDQTRTPDCALNLGPGDLVEVKSLKEIQATLDTAGRNRGLSFEPEMGIHCGRRYRVVSPIRRIISEQTGKMIELNNTVILGGVSCEGLGACNCPRANYFFWREAWLKRVDASPQEQSCLGRSDRTGQR